MPYETALASPSWRNGNLEALLLGGDGGPLCFRLMPSPRKAAAASLPAFGAGLLCFVSLLGLFCVG